MTTLNIKLREIETYIFLFNFIRSHRTHNSELLPRVQSVIDQFLANPNNTTAENTQLTNFRSDWTSLDWDDQGDIRDFADEHVAFEKIREVIFSIKEMNITFLNVD